MIRRTRTLFAKPAKRSKSKLQGQGNLVPEYLGGGAWVVENTIYLSLDYSPEPDQTIHDFPKATGGHTRPSN